MKKKFVKKLVSVAAVLAVSMLMLCSCAGNNSGDTVTESVSETAESVSEASDTDAAAEVSDNEVTESESSETAEEVSENALSDIEQLKKDIVGMWIDEGGPVMGPSPVFGDNYQFYEFTSDNRIIYHHLFKNADGTISEGQSEAGTYRIDKDGDKNLLVYETQNAGAYIDIVNGTMTMTNDNGSTRYTKLTLEQTSAYLVFYADEGLAAEQEDYMLDLYEKEAAEREAQENADDAVTESETDGSAETDITDSGADDAEQSELTDADESGAADETEASVSE